MLAVLLLGGATAGLVSELAGGDGDDGPDVPDRPLGITAEPPRYRIVYEVRAGGGDDEGDVALSTEVLAVRRPFESRVVVRRGAPPGGEVLSVEIAALGGLQTGGATQAATVLQSAPRTPPADLRLAAVLDGAVARGVIERRERRTVEGRRCDVYRSSGDTTVDRCVDEAGLVLAEEVLDEAGEVVRRKTAVIVDDDPELAGRDFGLTGEPLAAEGGGGSFARLTDDSRPPGVDFWELPAPPAGFRHAGRFAVVESLPGPLGGQGGARSAVVADAYVAGPDLVVVDNGGTTSGAPFAEDPAARPADVGALGDGQVLVAVTGAEVRVRLEGNRFVRVSGTLAADELLAVARDLRRRPPGTLTTVPDR